MSFYRATFAQPVPVRSGNTVRFRLYGRFEKQEEAI